MTHHEQLFIGGQWVEPATTDRITVVSPHTEEVVATVAAAGKADADRAVDAARSAFDEGPWAGMAPAERADVIAAISAAVTARYDEFARAVAEEMGSPYSWAVMGQVLSATMVLDYFANLARTFVAEELRAGVLAPALVRHEPVGVVVAIVPWNVPLFIAALKLGPCLAAGATMVLKPSPEAPLALHLLTEIAAEAGLPPGVLNVVPAGADVGEHLVRHSGVDKVSFTGSTAAGRRVGAICGEQVKRVTLELGGKSAAIVLDDADLDALVPNLLANSIFMNNGEACIAQTRILASRARYDDVVEAVATAVAAAPVGDPLDPETAVGPLVTAQQRDRVEGYLAAGRSEGARVVVGGGRPAALDRGWYVEPTVFADVDNAMTIAREEIFGPVAAVIAYDDVDDAVRIANDSEYGLSGSVWTADAQAGVEVARRIRTGTYGVNGLGLDPVAPYGGFKASGLGRELGPEGLADYTESRTIIVPPGFAPA
jgi:betaine-aldehyde dehydrogenase